MKFHRPYVFLALSLFLIEVLIAAFVHDQFIRPTVGDFLVVMLIYCVVKTFWDLPYLPTAIGVLIFAYAIEITQYFHLIDILGLQDSLAAKLIMGNSFSWEDMIAYTIGLACVIGIEWYMVYSRKNGES